MLGVQAHKDLFHWGGRMSGLVQDLTASMEATPPPAHTLGAHLLQAKYPDGELVVLLMLHCLSAAACSTGRVTCLCFMLCYGISRAVNGTQR